MKQLGKLLAAVLAATLLTGCSHRILPSVLEQGTTDPVDIGIPLETREPFTPMVTVPQIELPRFTVPETTAPETTVPETTVPETTEPETTDPPSKADDYYNDTSESVEVLDAEDSETVLTEAQAVALLRELGFTENPVYFEYMEDGTHVPEEEASEASDQKHPIYHTLHYSGRQELWNIYLMNGSLMAYPVVYNMSLGSGPELMVSETNTIIGYDGETNRFFITVPKAEVMTVKVIERIDAAALDGLNLGGQS